MSILHTVRLQIKTDKRFFTICGLLSTKKGECGNEKDDDL